MSENIFAPFMREALALAENGRWSACPNPTVGAVLVRDGQVVARGWHHAAGQPHAEVECLRDAQRQGIDPAQCTLVVTLEPCNHYGKTPPCSEAVLAAGIKRVVIGLYDPTPKAAGGAERLRAAGVEVIGPVCEQECRDQVADFLAWQQGRPYVILKMAATMDGRIATRTGHSRWVSSEGSRALVHRLRAGIGRAGGAVLVGGGTFRADNPCLTARIPGETVERQPLACVLTSRLPNPAGDIQLLKERPHQAVFLCSPAAAASTAAHALRQMGVRVLALGPGQRGCPDFPAMFHMLYEELHCPYVLCEGGGHLALSLLEAGFADEFLLHLAPRILGDNEAAPLFDGRSPLTMAEALDLRVCRTTLCDGDVHLQLRPAIPQE